MGRALVSAASFAVLLAGLLVAYQAGAVRKYEQALTGTLDPSERARSIDAVKRHPHGVEREDDLREDHHHGADGEAAPDAERSRPRAE